MDKGVTLIYKLFGIKIRNRNLYILVYTNNTMVKYQRISITLPKDLFKKFREYCNTNAINMSGLISKQIEKFLEQKR